MHPWDIILAGDADVPGWPRRNVPSMLASFGVNISLLQLFLLSSRVSSPTSSWWKARHKTLPTRPTFSFVFITESRQVLTETNCQAGLLHGRHLRAYVSSACACGCTRDGNKYNRRRESRYLLGLKIDRRNFHWRYTRIAVTAFDWDHARDEWQNSIHERAQLRYLDRGVSALFFFFSSLSFF